MVREVPEHNGDVEGQALGDGRWETMEDDDLRRSRALGCSNATFPWTTFVML